MCTHKLLVLDYYYILIIGSYNLQQEILVVPLDNLNSMDELIWKENASQKFTVKSAYGVALGLLNKSPTAHSQAKSDGSFWKKIWKLNIPPKVRTLFWRACSNTAHKR